MPNGIGSIFGIHEQALRLQAKRAELLANNIVNQNTPNYRAVDFDLHALLPQQHQQSSVALKTSHPSHLSFSDSSEALGVTPREVEQASLDGNTVNAEKEKVEFSQNALQYQATLGFINARIRNIISAFKGGS